MALTTDTGVWGTSDLVSRTLLQNALGNDYDGQRDYYDVLGYPEDPQAVDYLARYLRQDIARTIVDAPANTSWRNRPEITDDGENDEESETAFEAAVTRLFDEHRLLHYLERTDKVAGIGRFGLLFLGVADGDENDMSDPVDEQSFTDLDDLAYLSVFGEHRVNDIDLVTDPANPRYGLPKYYRIEFSQEHGHQSRRVHWSRVVHVAEDLLEDEIHGRPRLEGVLNRLHDLEKVIGGSSEMTWRGADRKFVLDADPDMGQITDSDELKGEVEEMIHGLRPVAYTRGMDLQSIEGDTVDPSGIVDELLKLIAGETGIPQRILTGSERGELASTQDRATFYGRMGERQQHFCEPQMLRPILDRLIDCGILPDPQDAEYEVEWPALFELSDLEQAELQNKQAQALKQAAPSGDPGQLGTIEEIREQVLDWSPEMGSETDVEPDELQEPEEEEDETRDVFDDVIEDVAGPQDPEAPEAPTDAPEGETPVADGGDTPEDA